ncbi:hypothetical protein Ae331Ps2_1742 [Pseudonocardia sp. Ae331_Ps2]|nr:hypothetical protein Ae331Ps2_1742 [Pseudonocardia sp. Ae331_Ps2]
MHVTDGRSPVTRSRQRRAGTGHVRRGPPGGATRASRPGEHTGGTVARALLGPTRTGSPNRIARPPCR